MGMKVNADNFKVVSCNLPGRTGKKVTVSVADVQVEI